MPLIKVSSDASIHYMVPSCREHTDTIDHSKPTVVFLHPQFFDSHFFSRQHRDGRLAWAYNIVEVDHHYHGKSKVKVDDAAYDLNLIARDLLQVLTSLHIAKAHVFAVSLGSQIAIEMQRLAPGTTISTSITEESIGQYRFLRDACYEKADDGSDHLPSDVVSGLTWMYFGEGDESAHTMVEEWVETSEFKPSNRKLVSKIFSAFLDRQPVEPRYWATVKCPLLIIHGESDAACPASAVKDIYGMVPPGPSNELHVIGGAPHLLTWTHALQVDTLLADFLDKLTGIDSRQVGTPPKSSLSKKPSFFRRIMR
ncbi:alpha/beta-hydrolase [Hysterangium stoloniferum]|nr:alpha/beta-hydrolase [Hysterangium stoloniferum]